MYHFRLLLLISLNFSEEQSGIQYCVHEQKLFKKLLTKYQVCDVYNFINIIGVSVIKVELGMIDGCHVCDDTAIDIVLTYFPPC